MAPREIVLFLIPPAGRLDCVRWKEPLTIGVPLPIGFARDPAAFTAMHSDGSELPIQAASLERWPDGSLKWMLVDVNADIMPGAFISLSNKANARSDNVLSPLVKSSGAVFHVDTGLATFVVGAERFPFHDVQIEGVSVLDVRESELVVTDSTGRPLDVRITRIELERNGPVRAVLRIEASIGDTRSAELQMVGRLHFCCGTSSVRFDVTVRNPRPAVHKGGFWELGDPGSINIKDVSLRLTLAGARTSQIVRCSEEPDAPFQTYGTPFALYQHSSGGENWRSPTHRNRSGVVPLSLRGYQVTAPGLDRTGLRSTPIVQLGNGRHRVSVAMERFWENFPKSIQVRDGALSLHLFPGEHSDLYEIQGGEQKTHTFWISLDADDPAEPALEWIRNPAHVIPDPTWCCESGVVPFLTPRDTDPHRGYLDLVDSAIAGEHSFVAKRETTDEFGWRNFGEVYADHEAVFQSGEQPLVSHYNNQYDAIAGFAYQLLRSGNPSWRPLMDDLARHVVDIDIYHTDGDWPKYNHGLFWHTVHYKDAGLSTHRTYPRTKGVYGGGPSAGHLYTTGLMLHHFITGSPQSRDAVIELATFVIDADDGSKSIFRWFDRGRTGFATASATQDYHGPGRAPGNALNALLDAHELSGESRFLEKAEEIIRRCIHPADDIGSLHLLDAERRWFYTMFLQALAKFLLWKRSIGQMDEMYLYAQQSLLAYAAWMADHEYPFLTKPELLEYPTETWAAQDMRKSEVFKWGALFADGTMRQRFIQLARFYYEYSVNTLSTLPTRTLARPVILMLAYGWNHPAFSGDIPRLAMSVPAGVDFGRPVKFVTQKRRAIRKAKIAAACLTVTVLSAAVALLRMFWIR